MPIPLKSKGTFPNIIPNNMGSTTVALQEQVKLYVLNSYSKNKI